MDQHGGHAECVGDQAGMLAAGAAKAVEGVAGDVIAALHGYFLDRVRHVLDRDADEPVGDLLAPAADLVREFRKGLAHRLVVERLLLRRPEDLWKKLRRE